MSMGGIAVVTCLFDFQCRLGYLAFLLDDNHGIPRTAKQVGSGRAKDGERTGKAMQGAGFQCPYTYSCTVCIYPCTS